MFVLAERRAGDALNAPQSGNELAEDGGRGLGSQPVSPRDLRREEEQVR